MKFNDTITNKKTNERFTITTMVTDLDGSAEYVITNNKTQERTLIESTGELERDFYKTAMITINSPYFDREVK